MSRLDLITVAIVIVCLGALAYLVYKIVDLMNPPGTETTAIEDSYSDPADDDSTYTDWDDEAATGEDVDLDDEDLGENASDDAANTTTEGSDNDSGNYDDSELDEGSDDVAEGTSSTSLTTADESGSTASSYDNVPAARNTNEGKYMVIAGTYRQKVNATNQVNKLRKLGYNDSEVKMFDRGSYALALVNRFSSYSDAKALVRKLADNGVEAMIKEKN